MALKQVDALVFDLYGTLLDVESLVERCRDVVPDASSFVALWRAKQLEYSFVRTILRDYADFDELTTQALDDASGHFDIQLSAPQRARLLAGWVELQPFPDVPAALRALEPWPRIVLSNGSPAMLSAALARSGLTPYFQHVLSADAVRRFKPDPAVYALVPAEIAAPPERMLFVSSNDFDIAGALDFGYQVCCVNRRGRPTVRHRAGPDITVGSLADIAGLLPPPTAIRPVADGEMA